MSKRDTGRCLRCGLLRGDSDSGGIFAGPYAYCRCGVTETNPGDDLPPYCKICGYRHLPKWGGCRSGQGLDIIRLVRNLDSVGGG